MAEERFLDRAKARASDTWDTTKEKFEETTEKSRDVIRENPFTAVLIAAAVGAIAGAVTSEVIRRSRRKENLMRKLRRKYWD